MLHTSEYFEHKKNNPRDPSHWHALFLDNSVPFNKDAKAAFLFDSNRKSKQFMLPFFEGIWKIDHYHLADF